MGKNKKELTKALHEMVDEEESGFGGTVAVKKEVKPTLAGSYCIYVPYKWTGEPVLVIFMDEDYSLLAVPENGRIPIKVSDYKQMFPTSTEPLMGKRVYAIPLKEIEELKSISERAIVIKKQVEKLKEKET